MYDDANGSRVLLAQHQALIDASAISAEVAAARGYWSATTRSELEALGFRSYQGTVPALVLPVHTVAGEVGTYQIRPDKPRANAKTGKIVKYETMAGRGLCIDVPPIVRPMLADPAIPLFVTEGIRKADAAASAGLACIDLLGVWGWRGRNKDGGSTVLACWESIALKRRAVFVVFDSDVTTKPEVRTALNRLYGYLVSKGARPHIITLPGGEGGKTGLDDYLAEGHGVDELLALVADDDSSSSSTSTAATAGAAVAALGALAAPRRTVADRLVELALGADVELWHTPAGVAHATLVVDGHRETHRVGSSAYRRWLTRAYYTADARAAAPDAIRQAIAVVDARAVYDGESHDVYLRVAPTRDGGVVLDLGDPSWRAVVVDADGWRIVSAPPVRFRRASGMLPLPAPVTSGTLDELAALATLDGDARVLAIGWLVAALRPRGPYPILTLYGEQGAGKSTRARMQRRLVDPSAADLRAQPREVRDLAVGAESAWVLALDNLSSVPDWLSDALCRVATGGGYAARTLYSDSDETILDAQRPMILTGIDAVATRGDLLDRALVVTLPRVENYVPESELWRDYAAAWPRMLGALLDAVARAVSGERRTTVPGDLRLADAARWVAAAEPACPWPAGAWVAAYADVRADAHRTAIDGSVLGGSLLALAARGPWSGTAAELLGALAGIVGEAATRARTWPRSPRGCAAELRRLAPALRAAGVETMWGSREPRTGRRLISLLAGAYPTVTTVTTVTPSGHVADMTTDSGPCRGDDEGDDGDRGDDGRRDRHRVTPRPGSDGDDGDDGDDGMHPSEGWPPEELV